MKSHEYFQFFVDSMNAKKEAEVSIRKQIACQENNMLRKGLLGNWNTIQENGCKKMKWLIPHTQTIWDREQPRDMQKYLICRLIIRKI